MTCSHLLLDPQEILRFDRHFPLIGIEGQQKLKNAKVLCIGAGGLGCPAALYLAAAGIGEIGIVDGDQVAIHNLHRQILYTEKDIGKSKAECAKEYLRARQPKVSIRTYPIFLNSANASEVIADYDVVLDGTDNYDSRYLINGFCRKLNKPLVSASIFQFDAQIGVFNYQGGPCYQCLFPTPPPSELIPNCAEAGVLGVLPGIAGTLQASEAMKIILGLGQPLSQRLLSFNLLSLEFRNYHVTPDTHCLACRGEFLRQMGSNNPGHPPKQSCEISNADRDRHLYIEPTELQKLMEKKADIYLLDVRQPKEREWYHIGGLSIPLQDLDIGSSQLPRNLPIVCYCKAGPRSLIASQQLKKKGFSSVYVLRGGILNWIDQIDAKEIKD